MAANAAGIEITSLPPYVYLYLIGGLGRLDVLIGVSVDWLR